MDARGALVVAQSTATYSGFRMPAVKWEQFPRHRCPFAFFLQLLLRTGLSLTQHGELGWCHHFSNGLFSELLS
jgi:hypothetical protein